MNDLISPRKMWEAAQGWLALGLGVKRWLLLLASGAIIMGTGIGSLLIILGQRRILPEAVYAVLTLQFLPTALRILLPLLVGGIVISVAIVRLGHNLIAPFRHPGEGLFESLYHYSQRGRGPHIVAIGGGTGLPSLLRGLTAYTRNITAIVTVADDGGSSGRLRKELGMLPPGDFRNNIAALARDEALMSQLLQYRFGGPLGTNLSEGKKGELQGHAFGNLLLAALTGITGSFDEGLMAAERVLALRGRVLPSTLANVALVAKVVTDPEIAPRMVVGESAIPQAMGRIDMVNLDPANVPAYPPAVRAILQADLVVIGPGSLYTSILPNLLVTDITRALFRTRAKRVYICNLATQPGETDNYDVADHVAALSKHIIQSGTAAGNWLDVILANDNLSVPGGKGGGNTIFVKLAEFDGIPLATADLVDDERPWRHDSGKLARAIMQFV